MFLALINQKGGMGKTKLAMHIAGELVLRGYHVMLLDADPQGSALDWIQRCSRKGLPRLFSAVDLVRETLHPEAPELAKRADHVIIDGPPRIATLARSALRTASRVLLPEQSSLYNLWASAETVRRVAEVVATSNKCIEVKTHPMAAPQAKAWIQQSAAADNGKAACCSARLALDLTPAMRTRMRLAAFDRGVTMAVMLSEVLGQASPEVTS